jgi:L-alanine-DL-glutamate epimerase-like enolase superfamily enzyme
MADTLVELFSAQETANSRLQKIAGFKFTRLEVPRKRVIGDSQIKSGRHVLGALELFTDGGLNGLGFIHGAQSLPSETDLTRLFQAEVVPLINDGNPFSLTNQIGRPRGGNIKISLFGQAVNQALWDLQGKILGLPLYRLLGGTSPKVATYASGLDYHLSMDEFCEFFTAATRLGFSRFKMKVGHPDLQWELERLKALVEIVGTDAVIMADANEAWTPKEAVRRLWAYHDAGYKLYWIEDPCLRDDYTGLRRIIEQVPFCHVNSGEYLDLHGKRLLLEHRAVDILNLHGHISHSLQAAQLAAEYGLPVSIGNTPLEIGVHLAAALPEVVGLEYSFHETYRLVDEPVRFEGGYAYAPDRPGHGLALSEAARHEYARPYAG